MTARLQILFLTLVAGSFLAGEPAEAKPLPAGYKYDGFYQGIIDELSLFPRPGPFSFLKIPLAQWPKLRAKNLEAYHADYQSLETLRREIAKHPEKQPLRTAVLEGIQSLKYSEFVGVETISGPPLKPAVRARLLNEQRAPGQKIFELEKSLARLMKAGEDRDKERSARWRAHFDYLHAMFLARLIFSYEYNHVLAQARRDNLPALPEGCPGWRIFPRTQIQINEGKAVAAFKQLNGLLKKIIGDYPGTPWAYLAQAELESPRGLEWRPNWK